MTTAAALPQLIFFAITVRLFTLRWSHHLPPALFAASLTGSLAMHSFNSPWHWASWLTLAAAAMFSTWDRGPRPVFWGLVIILVLVFAAIPGSLLWGSGNWPLSAGVAIWMAPSIVFYLTSNGEKVFAWLVPTWVVHAGLIVYQAFVERWTIYDDNTGVVIRSGTDPSGLAVNGNLAGGFLVLGMIYLLHTKHAWLAGPLAAALLLTGSRWAVIVAVVIVVLMLLTGRLKIKAALISGGLLFLASGILWFTYPVASFVVAGFDSVGALVTPLQNGEIGSRLAVPHIPSLLPTGIAEHPGLHNVPMRIAVENGILAALVWVGVTSYALFPGRWVKARWDSRYGVVITVVRNSKTAVRGLQSDSPRSRACWWMLLALGMLAMLDYYVWMGHLGGFWWLLVGMGVKR